MWYGGAIVFVLLIMICVVLLPHATMPVGIVLSLVFCALYPKHANIFFLGMPFSIVVYCLNAYITGKIVFFSGRRRGYPFYQKFERESNPGMFKVSMILYILIALTVVTLGVMSIGRPEPFSYRRIHHSP